MRQTVTHEGGSTHPRGITASRDDPSRGREINWEGPKFNRGAESGRSQDSSIRNGRYDYNKGRPTGRAAGANAGRMVRAGARGSKRGTGMRNVRGASRQRPSFSVKEYQDDFKPGLEEEALEKYFEEERHAKDNENQAKNYMPSVSITSLQSEMPSFIGTHSGTIAAINNKTRRLAERDIFPVQTTEMLTERLMTSSWVDFSNSEDQGKAKEVLKGLIAAGRSEEIKFKPVSEKTKKALLSGLVSGSYPDVDSNKFKNLQTALRNNNSMLESDRRSFRLKVESLLQP